MVRQVLLGRLVLVRPVAADLHVEDLTPVERLESRFGGTEVVVFDEPAARGLAGELAGRREDGPVVGSSVLEVAVGDDLDALDVACTTTPASALASRTGEREPNAPATAKISWSMYSVTRGERLAT